MNNSGMNLKLRTFAYVIIFAFFSLLTLPTQAALIGVLPATPGGTDYQAYYDDIADLSWTANAKIITSMTWTSAINTANNLDINGVTGWRLPSSLNSDGSGPCLGFSCSDSEMGNLYYNVLGNPVNGPLTNTGPFSNVQNQWHYWTSTVYAAREDYAYIFKFHNGQQDASNMGISDGYVWAVQTGNVGASTVPVPAAVWLFCSGLLSLIGISRRKTA